MTELVSAAMLASEMPIAFFGYATAKPEHRDALRELMLSLGDPSRAEAGVLSYEIFHDASRPDSIAFYELYANGPAAQSHMQQPHMTRFFAESAALLASDLEIVPLRPVRSGASGSGEA